MITSTNNNIVTSNYNFTRSDIKNLQKLATTFGPLGLRHVTGKAFADQDKAFGVQDGCSLALYPEKFNFETFASTFDCEQTSFEQLKNKKIEALTEEEESIIANCFQKAVTKFIKQSILLDLDPPIDPSQTTKIHVILRAILNSQFSILEYNTSSIPTQTEYPNYGGLGKFEKSSIKSDKITRVKTPNLVSAEDKSLKDIMGSEEEFHKVINYITDGFLASILTTVRAVLDKKLQNSNSLESNLQVKELVNSNI